MSTKMSAKIHSTLTACFVSIALAVSLAAPGAAAASRHRHIVAHHAHHVYVLNREYRIDRVGESGRFYRPRE